MTTLLKKVLRDDLSFYVPINIFQYIVIYIYIYINSSLQGIREYSHNNTVHFQVKFCSSPQGSPNPGQHLLDRFHLPAKLPTTGRFQPLDQDSSLSIVPSGDHSQHYASPQSIPSSGHYLLDKVSLPFHLGPTKVSISCLKASPPHSGDNSLISTPHCYPKLTSDVRICHLPTFCATIFW